MIRTVSDVTTAPPASPLPVEWNVEPLDGLDLLSLREDCDFPLALEEHLACVARTQAAIDVAIGDGLVALSTGERAMRLGWSSIKDYGRELLDVADRTVLQMAQLARELQSRPLLRAEVRSGEVSPRAARAVLMVAVGAEEARWVESAKERTVRALEETVRASSDPDAGEEAWQQMCVAIAPEKRPVVDEALGLAGRLLGAGSTPAQRLEALAMEFLGSHPGDESKDGDRRLVGGAFRPLTSTRSTRIEALKAQLEGETARWSNLPGAEPYFVADAALEEDAPQRIDARLKELAAMRRSWDRQVGYLANIVKRVRLWELVGFASFEHYCSERLGLGVRTVEQRAALEQRLWEEPLLRKAVEEGLSYEKARLVSRYHSPGDVEIWIARAREDGMTVVALRRAMEADDDAQMRARRRLVVRVPSNVALLLAAAFRAVREIEGKPISSGECLVRLAEHFVGVWKPPRKAGKTRSQKVLERDLGWCTCPGCSRCADDSHHVEFRSRGGGDELPNQTSLCKPHHLRGVHLGRLRVWGRAPDALVWELGERVDPRP
jgi:hypothetical protein